MFFYVYFTLHNKTQIINNSRQTPSVINSLDQNLFKPNICEQFVKATFIFNFVNKLKQSNEDFSDSNNVYYIDDLELSECKTESEIY